MSRRRRPARDAAGSRIAIVLTTGLLLSVAMSAPANATGSGALTGLTTPTQSSATQTTPITVPQTGPLTVPETTSTSASSGDLSGTEEIAIFIAAAVLILGIARIIVTDSRRHARPGAPPDLDRAKGTIAPIEHRLKRSRAKAKRARRARRAGR